MFAVAVAVVLQRTTNKSAAVIIPTQEVKVALADAGVTDSKRLTAAKRQQLNAFIRQQAICAVGMASAYEIDRINILNASLTAMYRAVMHLSDVPQICLVDGNQRIPNLPIDQETVVKGDQSVLAIAAASIVAKVWRDTLIIRLDKRYPGYDLASNKGYGSAKHRAGIAKLGTCRQHRKSFRSCQPNVSPKR